MCGGLGSICICSLVGSLVYVSSQRLLYTVVLYGVAITFSSFNPSPNFSIRVPDLSPVVGCESLHLSQSASVRASQRTAMLGSCLQIWHSISNSVRNWCPPMGWIQIWAGHWSAIPSVSGTFMFLYILWVKSFVGGLMFPSLHWGSCLATGGGLFRFHMTTVRLQELNVGDP